LFFSYGYDFSGQQQYAQHQPQQHSYYNPNDYAQAGQQQQHLQQQQLHTYPQQPPTYG